MLIIALFFLSNLIWVICGCKLCWVKLFAAEETCAREALAQTLILAVINNITTAFVLALIGYYSLPLLTIVLAIECAILCLLAIKQFHQSPTSAFLPNLMRGIDIFMVIVLLASTALAAFFPTYYMWARRDPAVYLISGVNIAKTGGTALPSNDYITEHYSEISDAVNLEYRGVYSDYLEGDSGKAGDVTLQFLHYFPAALAIGYSIAGLAGAARVNIAILALCLLAVYYFCKRPFGTKVAKLATLLVAVNPAQIWGGRITQTELLFQLFFLWGLYIFWWAWIKRSALIALFAGLVFGFSGLNRIDAYIMGAGILVLACYANIWLPKYRRECNALTYGYLAASALSLLYSYCFSKYYIVVHWNAGVLRNVVLLNLFLVVCAVLCRLLGKNKWLVSHNFFETICDNPTPRAILFILLIVVILATYFIRPLLQTGLNVDTDFNCRALVEFCWYISVLSIPLFLFGLWDVLGRKNLRLELLAFLLIGFSTLAIYIIKPAIAPDHIWASRRWVSVCFPFVLIFVARGIVALPLYLTQKSTLGKWIVPVTGSALVAFSLFQSRAFLFTSMLKGMPEQYDELAAQLDDDTLYIAQQSHFASILRFVYGKNVVTMADNAGPAILNLVKSTGNPVYFIGNISVLGSSVQQTSVYELYDCNLSGTYLVQENGKYATSTYTLSQPANVYRIGAPDEAFIATYGTPGEAITTLKNAVIQSGCTAQKQSTDGNWKTIYKKGIDDKTINWSNGNYALLTNAANDEVRQKLAESLAAAQEAEAEAAANAAASEDATATADATMTESSQIQAQIDALGAAQYSVFGPGVTLTPGSYRATFTLECLNADAIEGDALGYCDVSANSGVTVLASFPVTKTLLEGTAKTLALDFSTAAGASLDAVEFRVFTEANVQFRITDISYQFTGPQTQALISGTDDIRTASSLLDLDAESLPVYVAENSALCDTVSVTDLQSTVPGHAISVIPLEAAAGMGNAVLLIPADEIAVITPLLSRYTVVARLQNYALLLPTGASAYARFADSGSKALSNGSALSLRYYAASSGNSPVKVTAVLPAGSYHLEVSAQVPGASLFTTAGTLSLTCGNEQTATDLTKDTLLWDAYTTSIDSTWDADTKIEASLSTIAQIATPSLDIWVSPTS